MIWSLFSRCTFLIHRFAWLCGSIMSGQRRPSVEKRPFSVLKSSAGRPMAFHSRTTTGSARRRTSENAPSTGTVRSLATPTHDAMRSVRKFAVKAPR